MKDERLLVVDAVEEWMLGDDGKVEDLEVLYTYILTLSLRSRQSR